MMRAVMAAALAASMVGVLSARPFVAGYERFHRHEPTAEGGAILFSELGCANCHGGSAVVVPRRGPSLNDLAQRVERDWVVAFLADPGHGHKGSTMPSLFASLEDPERGQAVEEVTAWLGTLRGGLKLKAARHANAERGSALYHEMGCVACHAPTPDVPGHPKSAPLAVPLPDLARKTSLTALSDFLVHTDRYRPDARMPRFPLEPQDSIDLAAHLLDFQSSDPREATSIRPWPKVDAKTIAAGKRRAEAMGCASCHELPGLETPPLFNLRGASWGARHCLSDQPLSGLPHYGLAEDQRAALRLYLRSDAPARRSTPATFAALNCHACHERDGQGGAHPQSAPFFVGDEGLGDSGRFPPPLTGVGGKLKKEWLPGVFRGEHRVRPYLKTRMPHYPGHAQTLADWLTRLDAPAGHPEDRVHPPNLEAGRTLLGTEGGMGCITCHQWGERNSLGIPGMDLSTLDQRLQPEWFHRYLLAPSTYRPGTLMPSFWPDGRSAIPEVLDGDPERQIAAIWQFIARGEGAPPGFPDRGSGRFELVPKDRPIIQRTFLKDVGTQAILVGFPAGVHLAYDGGSARPALAWRGRFFDAYTTWFSRFAPFETPLEEKVHPFALPDAGKRRFGGYTLEEDGTPTFLCKEDGREITEHFSAKPGLLVRTVRWPANEPPPPIGHPEGLTAETQSRAGELVITYTFPD